MSIYNPCDRCPNNKKTTFNSIVLASCASDDSKLVEKIQSLEQELARLKEENLKLNEYKFMYEGLCK